MFRKKEQSKAINLLDTLYEGTTVWDNMYIWLVTVGKYLLIVVQIIVLGVFFSRFILDRKNNDLTEEINNKVVLLSNDTWERNAFLFQEYQTLLTDIRAVKNGQTVNSLEIRELISGIPPSFTLESLSFRENKVSLRIKSNNLNTVRDYESALKNNPQYQDVRFSVTKQEALISASVSFNLVKPN